MLFVLERGLFAKRGPQAKSSLRKERWESFEGEKYGGQKQIRSGETPLSGAGSLTGSSIAFWLPPKPRVPAGEDKVVLEEAHCLPLG